MTGEERDIEGEDFQMGRNMKRKSPSLQSLMPGLLICCNAYSGVLIVVERYRKTLLKYFRAFFKFQWSLLSIHCTSMSSNVILKFYLFHRTTSLAFEKPEKAMMKWNELLKMSAMYVSPY